MKAPAGLDSADSIPALCPAALDPVLTPPVTTGLTGYYLGASYMPSSRLWQDMSGANNHAQGAGSVGLKPDCINGMSCVNGSTNGTMRWPQVRAPHDALAELLLHLLLRVSDR